jgi:hypothetical protein
MLTVEQGARRRRRTWLIAIALITVPGLAVAGISMQGISMQGISMQGISMQGISMQGISMQGISMQGISMQGISMQGISMQGISMQGISMQGAQSSGVPLMGGDLGGPDLAGVDISSVDLRGTTAGSAVQAFELTSGPGVSTGSGDYISVGGASAVGHYAVAHLVDAAGNPAEDLDLYIADERPDPVPNLLHRGDDQTNDDTTLYTVFFFHRWSGQWVSLCPFHAATGGATAMAIAEDPSQPNRFFFACTATGVAAKCARIWGFRPWRNDHSYVWDDSSNTWTDQTYAMKPFYDACKIAARAAYCQDRQSFTRNGTLVDLYDTRQLVWPNAIENPFGDDPDSRWMFTQEYFVSVDPLQAHPEVKATALERTRYRELSPVGRCADFAFIDRLEQDNFEDGRWASPLTSTPRIQVFSPNYCTHNEHEVGAGLAWDCSPCTTSVCKTLPRCCRQEAGVPDWDSVCVAAANATCSDPPGRVFPRDLPPSTDPPQKYLTGATGAVERVDGPGASGATLSGWACDPEWPGAAVAVAVYTGAPREQLGSTLVGQATADQPLALPLAHEVSAACDGAVRDSARHGFSLSLKPGTRGTVFVYALDAATPDGPAAPPTLVRNGIVTIPTPLPSGQPLAPIATGWIEAPASGTFTFSSAVVPSRLYVNGQKLVDWWDGSGTTAGSIALTAGAKYQLRWDRIAGALDDENDQGNGAATSPPGLTWQVPGASGQAAIPPALLYHLAAGTSAHGLAATYYGASGFTGTSVARVDPVVDLGASPPAAVSLPGGISASSFSVVWQGELMPLYSDSYTFTVTSAGSAQLRVAGQDLLPPDVVAPPVAPACAHDICALGDKLAASTSASPACHPCVDQICAQDPFCCNGGYQSYYSSEPDWDAKCVAEVGAICGLTCANPLPSPTTRQRLATPVALQAGVRYTIRLAVDDASGDPTTQLIWESARQARDVVPTSQLFPAGATAQSAGAGLDLTVFATATVNGVTQPDLTQPLAAGVTPDLTLAPPTNALGLPLVNVAAAPSDPVAGVPPPPAVVTPRFGAHDVEPAPQVALTVMGGVRGGAVHARVQGTSVDVVLPFDGNGNLSAAAVPVPSYGAQTLVLTQRSYAGASCTPSATTVCAESTPVNWPVTVDAQAPPSPPPPTVAAPRDPTNEPDPTSNVFRVSGRGTAAPASACDDGGIGGAGIVAQSLTVGADGTISGTVTLTSGSSIDANPGWHKLSLSQDGCASKGKPAFVSVGIRPPTVEFPRSGAPVDCSAGGIVGQLIARGSIPYSQASFGPLVVAEELGRLALGLIPAQVTVDATARADGSLGFQAIIPALPFGKHLLYFFQAPPPPAGATQAEIDAHFRAFASIATTPSSRIALSVPPPPLALPVLGGGPLTGGPAITLGALNCALQGAAGCAQPNADVLIHDGPRVWTTRASGSGDWQISLADLGAGWHQLTLGQVVDSPAGGGWLESCPSAPLPAGVSSAGPGLPTLTLPSSLATDATSAAGAALGYDATAISSSGAALPVTCTPPSGAAFPIGTTSVLCTATDPATHAVAVGSFPVTIVDGPPVVSVPAQIITAEADSALGALVSYTVTATDAVSGPLPVDCVPSAPPGAPALFPLNQDTTVVCQATDGAGNTSSASFVVRVRDTTAPVLALPAAVSAAATSAAGAAVSYAASASDTVDPAPRVSCTPAAGALLPLGTTAVSCTATDASGNASQGSFNAQVTVSWSNLLAPISLQSVASFLRGLPIAVAFTLTGPSAGINNLGARLFVAPVSASGQVGAEQPAPGLAGNLFVFVPLTRQYLFTLSTLSLGAGTWQLRVDLGDGVSHAARIQLH